MSRLIVGPFATLSWRLLKGNEHEKTDGQGEVERRVVEERDFSTRKVVSWHEKKTEITATHTNQ